MPTVRRILTTTVLLLVATTLLLPAGGTLGAQQPTVMQQGALPALTGELASVRDLLDKYRDPMAAVRDGYFSTVACVDFPHGGVDGTVRFAPGAMGVHFLNMANVGPTLDPAKPQVLIYEPSGDSLRLVAAEWFVPAQLVPAGTRPSVLGQELVGPMEGHPPIMPKELVHYDLHVWLWRDNPAGTFVATNRNVSCPAGKLTHAMPAAHAH
jgi:hypothetical protein